MLKLLNLFESYLIRFMSFILWNEWVIILLYNRLIKMGIGIEIKEEKNEEDKEMP